MGEHKYRWVFKAIQRFTDVSHTIRRQHGLEVAENLIQLKFS